jgi:hypothetical protein
MDRRVVGKRVADDGDRLSLCSRGKHLAKTAEPRHEIAHHSRRTTLFAKWGSLAHHRRRVVMIATLALTVMGGMRGLGVFDRLSEGGFGDLASEDEQRDRRPPLAGKPEAEHRAAKGSRRGPHRTEPGLRRPSTISGVVIFPCPVRTEKTEELSRDGERHPVDGTQIAVGLANAAHDARGLLRLT